MDIGKFKTLASYGYQACVALVLVAIAGHLLPAKEFSIYSLSISTAQFIGIGATEWLRLAASRFYPGHSGRQNEERQYKSIISAAIAATFLSFAFGGLALAFGASLAIVATSLVIAFGQGATDILLTMLRFRGNFELFSRSQILRSTLMIGLGAAGCFSKSAVIALSCIATAYVLAIGYILAREKNFSIPKFLPVDWEVHKEHALYGLPAAFASVLHLAGVLGARYFLLLILEKRALAGALLALDVAQKPFNVATSALSGILYPPVVKAHDSGNKSASEEALKRLYKVQVTAIGGLLMILIALTPAIAAIAVTSTLRPSFYDAAVLAFVLFALRAILINLTAIPFHLRKQTGNITIVASVDIAVSSISMLVVYLLHVTEAAYVLGALCAGALLAIVASFTLQRALGSGLH